MEAFLFANLKWDSIIFLVWILLVAVYCNSFWNVFSWSCQQTYKRSKSLIKKYNNKKPQINTCDIVLQKIWPQVKHLFFESEKLEVEGENISIVEVWEPRYRIVSGYLSSDWVVG